MNLKAWSSIKLCTSLVSSKQVCYLYCTSPTSTCSFTVINLFIAGVNTSDINIHHAAQANRNAQLTTVVPKSVSMCEYATGGGRETTKQSLKQSNLNNVQYDSLEAEYYHKVCNT